MAYVACLIRARTAFAEAVARRRGDLAPRGLVGVHALEAIARQAAEAALAGLGDPYVASAAGQEPRVMAWSPADEDGPVPGNLARYIRRALAETLAFDLEPERGAALLEGQDADTLPTAVEDALAALDEVERATGRRLPFRGDMDGALRDLDAFDAPLYAGLVSVAAGALDESGHAGIAEALRAARDARGLLPDPGPSPR